MQKQTPNEILLNYPKLKGGKGEFKRSVVPRREYIASREGKVIRERTESHGFLPRVPVFDTSDTGSSGGARSSPRDSSGHDDIDDVLKYRPSFVARMSGLTYIRSPSPKQPRRKINSATSRITCPRNSSTTAALQQYRPSTSLSAPINFRGDERMSLSSDMYRCEAMKEVGRFRDTEYFHYNTLTQQNIVNRLRQESRLRRLKRMTPQDFVFYKKSRNQRQTLTQYFSLRMAFRVIKWKNKALATLAKSRANTEEIEKRKLYIKSLFKKRAKAIMLIYRWYKSLVAFSIAKTERSASELQWEESYLREHRHKKFEFDRAAFEQQKKQTKMAKWMKEILSKHPADRTKNDVKQLHDMFRGLSHFEKFTQKVQIELSRACTLLKVEPMRVILREGHKGQAFYFIYTGSVFINITETANDRRKTQYQKTRAILTRGEAFGEVALLRETNRMATVIARERCELLCVDKDTFAKVCPQMFDDELKNRVAYMQTHDLFVEGWDALALYNMALSSSVAEYAINQVISKNAFDDPEMYFVMDGFCTVVKCLSLDEQPSKPTNSITVTVTPDPDADSDKASSSVDFVDLLNDQAKVKKKSSAGEELRKVSESREITKDSLFHAMDMTYDSDISGTSSSKNRDVLEQIMKEQREMDFTSKIKLQRDKELKTMKNSTNSFTVFMSLTEKAARLKNKTAVFMQVGRLQRGDVFNIRDSLGADENQNDLILVSETCKVLKVKVLDFIRSLRNQDVYLLLINKIKHLKSFCPAEEDMIKLYRKNCNWEAYRQSVINKAKKKNPAQEKAESEMMRKLGKPWRADPDNWLCTLREKQRQMEIRMNQPLKPPIY